MGLWDKLRGSGRKNPAPAERAEAPPEIRTWLDGLFAQFQPERIRFEPGETLEQVFARLLEQEERRVRAANEPPPVQSLKLAALAGLREQFGLPATPQPTKEETVSEDAEGQPAEATYEMVMGGQAELQEVSLANFMQIIQGWGTVVETLGRPARLPESLLEQYQRVYVTVTPGEKEDELVAGFHGAREMVELFRQKLRELGLESG